MLWTCRKQAIIAWITDGVEKILHVESKAKGRQNLREYYREVIRAIQDAQEIFIFGPAQAKMELKIEILNVKTISHKVVGTETADTMTEDELVARAREVCRSRAV